MFDKFFLTKEKIIISNSYSIKIYLINYNFKYSNF